VTVAAFGPPKKIGLILPRYAVMFGLILCIVSRELPR
jgi:hypothetical protein